MYYYISGKIAKLDANYAVIDAGGVGYMIYISSTTLGRISGNDTAKLYTYYAVREDAQELYGFYDENELTTFKMLISVSGVGPKAALAVLSVLTPDKLALAVAAGDTKSILSAQGVGKKIAERIVLELKDKLGANLTVDVRSDGGETPVFTDNSSEAVNALAVLGYSRAEAMRAVGSVDKSITSIEDIIREALKIV